MARIDARGSRLQGAGAGFALTAAGLILLVAPARAQQPDSLSPSALKRLSLEQLMDVEVISVSRRPEKLSSTASAIQVITGEDIRRAGASSIPEALRLATNLQVAQVNASQWAVSARGFNNVLANKLLVLIDGRTIYTPLYSGVFWDVQDPPLESIDRIEVVSGPGGALWGANAVNGVINIITKSARETQGLYAEGGGGTELQGFGEVRYGARIPSGPAVRVYGMGFGRSSTALTTGGDAQDSWSLGEGGFRMDWDASAADGVTLQADYYDGRPDPDGGSSIIARGGNAIGRWARKLSEGAGLQVQAYFDRTWRDFRNGFTEGLSTYDVDAQHRFPLGRRQEVVWGLSARLMDHKTENLPLFAFEPAHRTLHRYSAFVQDEIELIPERLSLTLGSKFEHNDYTGFEVQPSVRLAWSPLDRHTVWAAVSRAVKTPSRLDRDFVLSLAPGIPIIDQSDLQSEEVLATELGWRAQLEAKLTASISTFYNDYDNIRTAEPGPPPFGIPITFGNGVRGHTYGAELAAVYQATGRWRLRGGYTFLKKDLSLKPGSNDANGATAESDDPEHQFLVQSMTDLPGRVQVDAVLRLVDELPDPRVPGYGELDVRLAWKPIERLELSVAGQNLLHDEHAEFIPSSPSPRRIERAVYGKVTWR